MIEHLNDDVISEEVDIINKERLILIQISAILAKGALDQHS